MDKVNINIYDLKNSGGLVSTIPTIQQMKEENARQVTEKLKREVESKNDEEFIAQMGKEMRMSDTIKTMIDYISKLYQEGSFLIIGVRPQKDYNAITIEDSGNLDVISAAISESMQHSNKYLHMVNVALKYFCRTSKPKEAEEAISGLQDIIEDLKKLNNPLNQIKLKQAESKRLRKAGRFDLAKIKEAEIEEIQAEIKAREDAERKKIELREIRLAALAKGRETMAAKREKARRAKQNPPQPNFAQMAKAAKKQKAAAKAARKKNKAGGGNSENLCSCSQLLNKFQN